MNKNLIVLTIGRLSQMLVMFFTYRVLSSVFSVADMGVYYFLLSISAAFGLIYANPIGMYTNRMLHGWMDHGVLSKNLKIVLLSLLTGSFLTIPFLLFFQNKISLDGQSLHFLITVLVFYVFATTFNGTVVPGLNFLGFTGHFVVWTFLTNTIGLIISYLMVTHLVNNPLYWLVGQGISLLFCGIIALLILFKKSKVQANQIAETTDKSHRIKKVLKFGLPIALTNVAVWGLGQSFRFFYKENVDLSILGELAFGLGLASSLCVAIEYLLQQIYFPAFYKDANDPNANRSNSWNHLLNSLIPPYILLMMFLIGLSPFLMRILADVKFKNAYQYLALGAVVEFFRMIGNIFTMGTQSEMKTHKAIGPYLCGGAITVVGVLFICHFSEYVKWTPFCLMAGYFTSLLYLRVNVGHILDVKMNMPLFLQTLGISLVFLSALFFKDFSFSMINSILITGVYGLALAFFMYKSYIRGKV